MRYQLIDRLIELVPQQRAVSRKTFLGNEDFFADHFPGFPVVPGALLTEAMGQTAGWLIAASIDFKGWPLLSMVHAAKFRRFVSPGEELRIEATIESMQASACMTRASVTNGGARVADASLSFQIFAPTIAGEGHQQFEDWTRETFAAIGGVDLLDGAAS